MLVSGNLCRRNKLQSQTRGGLRGRDGKDLDSNAGGELSQSLINLSVEKSGASHGAAGLGEDECVVAGAEARDQGRAQRKNLVRCTTWNGPPGHLACVPSSGPTAK